jgi:hypothetical protein
MSVHNVITYHCQVNITTIQQLSEYLTSKAIYKVTSTQKLHFLMKIINVIMCMHIHGNFVSEISQFKVIECQMKVGMWRACQNCYQ